jgi:porphobilinogen deaminase
MQGAEAALPSERPRRRVTLAVGAGPAGAEHARRVAERLTSSVREPFDVGSLNVPEDGGPGDPAALIRALLAGEAELAACCAERLPLELPSGVRLEAALRIWDAGYRLLSEPGLAGLDALPDDARLGACDEAARAQILHRRPTFTVELVPRESLLLTGLAHGVWDAAIVSALVNAAPGLEPRLLPQVQLVPPSGRGVIALLTLDDADHSEPWRRLLNEPETEDCLLCERAFLARVASGAKGVPIAHARRVGGRLELEGTLAHPDGEWLVTSNASGPPSFGRILGLEVAESCRELAARRVRLPVIIPGRSRA